MLRTKQAAFGEKNRYVDIQGGPENDKSASHKKNAESLRRPRDERRRRLSRVSHAQQEVPVWRILLLRHNVSFS